MSEGKRSRAEADKKRLSEGKRPGSRLCLKLGTPCVRREEVEGRGGREETEDRGQQEEIVRREEAGLSALPEVALVHRRQPWLEAKWSGTTAAEAIHGSEAGVGMFNALCPERDRGRGRAEASRSWTSVKGVGASGGGSREPDGMILGPADDYCFQNGGRGPIFRGILEREREKERGGNGSEPPVPPFSSCSLSSPRSPAPACGI